MQEHAAFELIGGHVALDFVNTLDDRHNPERVRDLIPTYAEFLRFCRQSGAIDAGQAKSFSLLEKDKGQALRAAHDVRENLEPLFRAIVNETALPAGNLDAFNAAVRDAQSHRALVSGERGLGWKWSGLERSPFGPLWLITDAAVQLLTSEDVERVRQCGNENCGWFFLDTSKNHSRRWCDMKVCGNRIKARNYYRRTRQEQASG